MEHHSNIVPWQMIAAKTGAVLKYVPLTQDETFDFEQYQALLSDKTKLVTVVHVSNTLGNVNPVTEIIQAARKYGAKILIDACQSLPHMPVDVQQMDCDWLVGSGHKMCAPTGIGFLYGKRAILEAMPPFLGGGEMIAEVFFDHSTYGELPINLKREPQPSVRRSPLERRWIISLKLGWIASMPTKPNSLPIFLRDSGTSRT